MPNHYGVEAAHGAFDITPSDDTALDPLRGIYVGTAGDVRIVFPNGDDVVYHNVPAGKDLHVAGSGLKVMATNTTASDLVAYRPNPREHMANFES